MFKKHILLIGVLSFFIGCISEEQEIISEIDDSHIEIKVKLEKVITIDPSTLTPDSIHSMNKIDSIRHLKILMDFPELKGMTSYDRFELLRDYRKIDLLENISSYLILQSHESWGIQLYLLNYKNEIPMSAYKLVECGGDGGYYECSKATIKNNSCKITSESGEIDYNENNNYQELKSSSIRNYEFDDSLNLVLINSSFETDTLNKY